jgi:DHA2 family multidrug resistance protein-like MFS transporter
MAVLLLVGPRALPEYRDENAGRIDLTSVALSILAILGVVFGLKELAQGGVLVTAVVAIVGGIVLGALFVRRQLRLRSPLIDVRLFRIRAFSASLVAYLLAIFTVVGYFLFVGQYLQLVLGLSPLQAALWSLPSALGFIAGSVVSPRIIHRFRPSAIMGVGMAVAALGAVILLFVGRESTSGLLLITFALVIMSVALSPVITLATELIVGSAPPEQAGAATGVSETSGELGGALGIAILGSLGTIVYRAGVANGAPADIPQAVLDAARDSLGGAIAVAASLPEALGAALVTAAQIAFVDALHVVAAVSAGLAAVAAVAVAYALRSVPKREDAAPEA